MSILKQAREDYQQELEKLGLRVYTYEEDNPKPPCAIVIPANPYYRPTGGAVKTMNAFWTIGLNIILIGQKGTKPSHTDFLDQAIEDTIKAIQPYAAIGSVPQPGIVELSSGEYFGVVIETEYTPPQ